jgi:hypothetical protein
MQKHNSRCCFGFAIRAALAAMCAAIILTACPTPTGGSGFGGSIPDSGTGKSPGSSGGGVNSGMWSQLLGTWKSADGNLEYNFFDGNAGARIITVDGSPPYQQWIAFFFFASTITSNTIGDGKNASLEYVLSDNNQTLTVTNFKFLRTFADNYGPGPINFNGTLSKQP